MVRVQPEVAALGALASYNVVQNLVVTERTYVLANLTVSAGLVAAARKAGLSLDDMGLGMSRVPGGLRSGSTVAMASGLTLLAVSSTHRFDRWLLDGRARGHAWPDAAYRALVRFPLGTALFEEVAFRGVLDGLWRRRRGRCAARLVTTVAFGAWHLLPTYLFYPDMGIAKASPQSTLTRSASALGGAVLTALSGLLFSALRERSDSVAAPWLVHATFNTGSYLAARRAWRGIDG